MAPSANKLMQILVAESEPWDLGLIEEAFLEINDSGFGRGRMGPRLVRPARYQMVPALSLEEAVDLLETQSFPIVLLDLFLPDSQALHTLFRIRERAPDPAIVILSDPEDEEMARQAIREGAQDYLLKSEIDAEPLDRCLRYAIERQLMQESARRTAFTDALTGLFTRTGFLAFAEHDRRLALLREENLTLLVAHLGACTGDRGAPLPSDRRLALMEAADLLRQALPETDVIARLDDDRFAALFVGLPEGGHQEVSERLEQSLRAWNLSPGRTRRLSMRFELRPVAPEEEPSIDAVIGGGNPLCENDSGGSISLGRGMSRVC